MEVDFNVIRSGVAFSEGDRGGGRGRGGGGKLYLSEIRAAAIHRFGEEEGEVTRVQIELREPEKLGRCGIKRERVHPRGGGAGKRGVSRNVSCHSNVKQHIAILDIVAEQSTLHFVRI